MILVPMRKDDCSDAVLVLNKIGNVGDNNIHAVHFLVGKAQAAVNDNDIIAVFKDGQVLSDLIKPSEANDLQF